MLQKIIATILMFICCHANAQESIQDYFVSKKNNAATDIKDQAESGTCWCFAATSLLESVCIKNKIADLDISEMFTVRNIYIEKAKNYILRQGQTQFSQGSQAHDMIDAIAKYGTMPEQSYSGLQNGETFYSHDELYNQLKNYLDSLIKHAPIPDNWLDAYVNMLDKKLGIPPTQFNYRGKVYTPKSFANDYLKFKKDDYITLNSFTHHPYYSSFILESPYNWSNGSYYNIPLQEFINITNDALANGYTILWNGDVSNDHFMPREALALNLDDAVTHPTLNPETTELKWSAKERQRLYENLTTTVDHVMHIVGIEKTKSGKIFYKVKNSWGVIGPLDGYLYMSESYYAINAVSITLQKKAIGSKPYFK